jgi:nicotinate-nucleotide adenylyltransferase
MRRIGLLGGSFNPAHRGHRKISLAAIGALGLDEVWWLVSPGNPLKPVEGMAPLAARVASARAAARRAPIRVTAIERELGSRYTIDTLRALRHRFPKRRFVWIMGADNLAQFHRWKDWHGIARSVPIAVFARPGYAAKAFASPAMAWLRRYRVRPGELGKGALPQLAWIAFDPDSVSATAIRRDSPDWAANYARSTPRDGVTGRLIG